MYSHCTNCHKQKSIGWNNFLTEPCKLQFLPTKGALRACVQAVNSNIETRICIYKSAISGPLTISFVPLNTQTSEILAKFAVNDLTATFELSITVPNLVQRGIYCLRVNHLLSSAFIFVGADATPSQQDDALKGLDNNPLVQQLQQQPRLLQLSSNGYSNNNTNTSSINSNVNSNSNSNNSSNTNSNINSNTSININSTSNSSNISQQRQYQIQQIQQQHLQQYQQQQQQLHLQQLLQLQIQQQQQQNLQNLPSPQIQSQQLYQLQQQLRQQNQQQLQLHIKPPDSTVSEEDNLQLFRKLLFEVLVIEELQAPEHWQQHFSQILNEKQNCLQQEKNKLAKLPLSPGVFAYKLQIVSHPICYFILPGSEVMIPLLLDGVIIVTDRLCTNEEGRQYMIFANCGCFTLRPHHSPGATVEISIVGYNGTIIYVGNVTVGSTLPEPTDSDMSNN